MLISYAQNFEDVLLWRALGHVRNGFYIDIGAQDPVVDSISLSFYEHGWRGVHVEPTPAYAQSLREARPDETVLQAAIGDEQALIPFFEIPRTGISTGDAEIARHHEASGFTTRRLEVPCVKLSVLLDGYKDRDIHWMKIDVEGMEQSVLRSWAPSPVRPWIVVVESTLPLTTKLSHRKWEASLLSLGYRFTYFDGLNRFYVSKAHRDLLGAFEAPPNVFDRFSLAGTGSHLFCDKLNRAVTQAREEVDRLNALRVELEDKLNRTQQDGEASRARVVELERLVSEQAARAELHVQEALTSAQRLAEALRGQERAKDESLELLRRLAAKSDAYETQMAAAQAESARQLAEFVRQREDALVVAARNQSAFDAARARLDAVLAELHESEARATAKLEQTQRELDAERNAQLGLRNTLDHARRDLEALQASWSWRIGRPARFLARRFRTGLTLAEPPPFTTGDGIDRSPSTENAISPKGLFMSQSTQIPTAAGSVEQLLSLHDDEFVRSAYLTVLRRPADTDGFANYLADLRAGTAKEKIVVELANSPEGRSLGYALPGLGDLVSRVSRDENSLVHRVRRQLGWQSRVPMERQLRRIENSLYRMGAESASRLDRLESEVAIIKQLVRHGAPINVREGADQRAAESPVEHQSVLASPVVLADPSPSRVVAGIAKQLAESQEAAQLFLGNRNRP